MSADFNIRLLSIESWRLQNRECAFHIFKIFKIILLYNFNILYINFFELYKKFLYFSNPLIRILLLCLLLCLVRIYKLTFTFYFWHDILLNKNHKWGVYRVALNFVLYVRAELYLSEWGSHEAVIERGRVSRANFYPLVNILHFVFEMSHFFFRSSKCDHVFPTLILALILVLKNLVQKN